MNNLNANYKSATEHNMKEKAQYQYICSVNQTFYLQGRMKVAVSAVLVLIVSLTFQIAALKCQMDNDAHSIEKISTEKSLLQGQIGELQAKIRTLEGQVNAWCLCLWFK